MRRASHDRFARALLASASSDAPALGAKGRALARIEERAERSWLTPRRAAGVVALLLASSLGRGLLMSPSVATAPPQTGTCGWSVEAPAGACGEASGSSSGGGGQRGATGSSSGSGRDRSGSSSG